jgi:hypothetical protein
MVRLAEHAVGNSFGSVLRYIEGWATAEAVRHGHEEPASARLNIRVTKNRCEGTSTKQPVSVHLNHIRKFSAQDWCSAPGHAHHGSADAL